MKPYGNTRRQNLTCAFGCCTLGTVKTARYSSVPKATRSRARKRARREGHLDEERYDLPTNDMK